MDNNSIKTCRKCQKGKSLDSFDKDIGRDDGKYPWCKVCRSQYNKEKYNQQKNEEYITGDSSKLCLWCEAGIGGTHKNRHYCSESCKGKARVAFSYGLTVDEYKKIMDSNNGICPICNRKAIKWNIDHNHETGESYGAVCARCNTTVLAFSYHDIEIAKRLVQYYEDPPIRRILGEPRYITNRRKGQDIRAKKYEPNPGVWVLKMRSQKR